ncbi:MAG: ArnT family glycosyltransferase [Anaerolineae bacterium]
MKRPYVFGMTLVLLVAAALRLGALPDTPVGLHYDEAANVVLARQIASGEYRPVFIRAYTGKEVLFFYAGAFWVWATGGAPWGLRLGAAMLGVLTVAATYAATRALLGPGKHSRSIALLAAGWVAVAFPHVLLSRYGFRAISQPLLQALTVATLWRGLRTGKRRWLVAGGACLGFTGYTYLAARLFPLPLTFALGWLLLRSPREAWRRLGQLGIVLLAAMIVFAPLGFYFLRNPDAFITRITQVAAPTWQAALRGLWRCVRAVVWPGTGDPYIRFNVPGKPVLDAISAVLALIGLAHLCISTQGDALHRAGRIFIVAVLATMLLPSALATSEITPSNLRLVGLFPFIAVLPAYAVVVIVNTLTGYLRAKGTHAKSRLLPPASCFLPLASCLLLLLVLGGAATAHAYRQWATSSALFYAADGEMTLAAEALDTTDLSQTTVYIASEHYRHPTVAALARHYAQAKWLTGGATLVLPPTGGALYLWPRSLTPPVSWPETITEKWRITALGDPTGEPALWVRRLSESDIAALRAETSATESSASSVVDFAHVIFLHDARPEGACRVAEPCPILITWEVNAPYTTLQPVVRLLHPETDEWARVTAFHYPPEQWAVGDVAFDQFALTPPVGIPPVDGYEIGVSFFNPDAGEVLPQLDAERFAGLEARFPLTGTLLSMVSAPDASQSGEACPGIPRDIDAMLGDLRLAGVTSLPESLRPGESLNLRLCWQATGDALPEGNVILTLTGPETHASKTHVLYRGAPASGYAFAQWRPGDIIEDRYSLRLPRETAAGQYALALSVGDTPVATLGSVEVQSVTRIFAPPEIAHPFEVDFGARIRLLGYDVGTLQAGQPMTVTLYWQSLAELDEDYLVFVHVLDEGGAIVTQVDEGPQQGSYPTSLWMAGEVVADRHTLAVPDEIPAGDYRLRIGFYRQENGDYLAANGNANLVLPIVP